MANIVINNLNVTLKQKAGTFHILKDLSVTFKDGKTSVIFGPSGCGKTTLLRAIIGLIDYQGEILFDDMDAKTISIQDKNVSYVSQNLSLFPGMSLFNNIAFPLKSMRISGDEIRRRVYEVAEMLHITPCLSRKPKQVSLGQCQRAAIARALIKRPNFFIFDEPFSALDNETSSMIIQDMKEIFKTFNSTVIFVSHDAREGLTLADEVFVMNEGTMIQNGKPDEIIYSSNPIVEALFKEI